MDIYQCMTCGWRHAHGGMHSAFVAMAKHVEEKRAEEGRMHRVLVGEFDQLADLYRRVQEGLHLEFPSQDPNPAPSPRPEDVVLPAERLSEFANRLGITNLDEARRMIAALFLVETTPERLDHMSPLEDVIPSGTVAQWGEPAAPPEEPDGVSG